MHAITSMDHMSITCFPFAVHLFHTWNFSKTSTIKTQFNLIPFRIYDLHVNRLCLILRLTSVYSVYFFAKNMLKNIYILKNFI